MDSGASSVCTISLFVRCGAGEALDGRYGGLGAAVDHDPAAGARALAPSAVLTVTSPGPVIVP